MKQCRKCKLDKNDIDFRKSKTAKDGLQSYCKQCSSEYSKSVYNKDVWQSRNILCLERFKLSVRDIKSKYGCFNCGMNNPYCLDFHHIDSSNKHDNVSDIMHTKSKKKVIEEINKCIVVCCNCHKLIHYCNLIIDKNKRCIENIDDFNNSINFYLLHQKNLRGV